MGSKQRLRRTAGDGIAVSLSFCARGLFGPLPVSQLPSGRNTLSITPRPSRKRWRSLRRSRLLRWRSGACPENTVHVALEDASGDSAILEYLGGKLVVHQGREFRVMTNASNIEDAWRRIGALLDCFIPTECANHF